MDINMIIGNEKLLFGLAVIAITWASTQIIKKLDKNNKAVDYYPLIAIGIGGVLGYVGGHYLIPSVGDGGALLGIVAAFAYEKTPDSIKDRIFMQSNDKLTGNITPSRND